MAKYSICGRDMSECRLAFLDWIASSKQTHNMSDSWADYCKAYWLNQLGGLGASW